MFFLAIYLEPWFFFFTLTTMSQNFLHTQHGTKLFVFLGLLAWFAVSVTLRRFFCQFTWNHGFSFSR